MSCYCILQNNAPQSESICLLLASLEFINFHTERILGQEEAGASQPQVVSNLSIPLSTVNCVITQFNNQAKETVDAHSGHPSHQQDASRDQQRENLESQLLMSQMQLSMS